MAVPLAVALGIALRIAAMPLFAHLDAVTTAWVSLILAERGQMVRSNDPRPIFFVTAGVLRAAQPILRGLPVVEYLLEGPRYTPGITLQSSARLLPGVNILVFLVKIPYLVADLCIAWMLVRLAPDRVIGRRACAIWMLNPVGIYVSYVIGQFDVVAAALFVVSLLALKEERPLLAALGLGASAAFRTAFIMVAPFYAIYVARRRQTEFPVRKAAYAVGQLVLPALLVVVPQVYPRVPTFYESANLAMAGTELNGYFGDAFYNRGRQADAFLGGLIEFGVNYSGRIKTFPGFTDEVLVVPGALTVLVLFALRWRCWNLERLRAMILAGMLVFFAGQLFHPQWFMWAQPLLTLWLAGRGKTEWAAAACLVGGYFVHTWRWGRPTTVETLLPAFPRALQMPGPHELLSGARLDPDLFISFGRSVFSGAAGYVAVVLLWESFWVGGPSSRNKE